MQPADADFQPFVEDDPVEHGGGVSPDGFAGGYFLKCGLLGLVYIISFRTIWIISCVFTIIDIYHVSVDMLASLDFGNNVSTRHVFSISDIVMFISATGAIIFSCNFRHVTFPSRFDAIDCQKNQVDHYLSLESLLERLSKIAYQTGFCRAMLDQSPQLATDAAETQAFQRYQSKIGKT